MKTNKIAILSFPSNKEKKPILKDFSSYSLTKSDSDGERRYLCGVSSGLAVDAHGERMSEECVKDFLKQTNEKDITLYVNHGKDYSSDIGILTKSEVTPDGDWYTEYRLYDDKDPVPQADKELAEKIWRQANGLPPYKKPRQFGFSIEGFIPDDQIRESATGKEILKVDLDPGVSLVSKPAYTASVATAIQKALHITIKTDKPIDGFTEIINTRKSSGEFFESLEELADALDEAENKILTSSDDMEMKSVKLRDIYSKYLEMRFDLMKQVGFSLSVLPMETPEAPGFSDPMGESLAENKTKEEDMDNTILANIQALLEQLVQAEAAEAESMPEMKAEEEKPEEKAAAAKSAIRLKAYKQLQKLIAKAEEEMEDEAKKAENDSQDPDKETIKAEADAASEEEAKAIDSILKEVSEEEGAGSGEDVEDELEEVMPSDDALNALKSALVEAAKNKDFKSVKSITASINALKSASKPAKKESHAVKAVRILANEIKALKSGSVQPRKDVGRFSDSIQKSFTKSLEETIKTEKGIPADHDLLNNSRQVMKAMFGGRN